MELPPLTPGALCYVATSTGNLVNFTLRGSRMLHERDLVVAEET